MKRLCALLTSVAVGTAMAGIATAQTRPGTGPIGALAHPLGSGAAISGQSRPLGGLPAYGGGYGNRPGRSGPGRRGGVYGYGYGVPYGFSTYLPGYWDTFGDTGAIGPYSSYMPYGEAPPPPVALPAPAPGGPVGGAAPSTVIINQYYGYPPPGAGPNGPEQVEHPGDPLTEPENYYLLVYKDHSIHAALAYWVEGNTLHYVTTDNVHNQVSLDLVDIAASTKLNSDHNVPFSVTAR